MKAVILAGGIGSRLSEETTLRPKPMVEIGGRPILWHIMKSYSAFGITEFIICLGYKGYVIKEYFANYHLHMSDVTYDLAANSARWHESSAEPWTVTLTDTGPKTMTGGRLLRALEYVADEDFCFTYGDAVADIDINALVEHHQREGRLATLTAVHAPGRFGSLELSGDRVSKFSEKAPGDGGWINGGFFVLSPDVRSVLHGDDTVWEGEPLERLAAEDQLTSYRHQGFWQPMDTLRDKHELQLLCDSGNTPWLR